VGDVEEFLNACKTIDQASGGLVGLGCDVLSAIGDFLYEFFHHLEEFPYSKGVEGFGSIKTIHGVSWVLMNARRVFGR